MYHSNLIRRWLREAVEDAKLDAAHLPKLKWHNLRETFGSMAIRDGADVVFLSRQLGHANPSITLAITRICSTRRGKRRRTGRCCPRDTETVWKQQPGTDGETTRELERELGLIAGEDGSRQPASRYRNAFKAEGRGFESRRPLASEGCATARPSSFVSDLAEAPKRPVCHIDATRRRRLDAPPVLARPKERRLVVTPEGMTAGTATRRRAPSLNLLRSPVESLLVPSKQARRCGRTEIPGDIRRRA